MSNKRSIDDLEREIQAAQKRFDRISEYAENLSDSASSIESEISAELATALEELQVTVEELYQQQEELLAARQEVELERQRYQNFFEFAPDGYLVTDSKGIIREANYAAENLFNIPRNLIIGKPFIILVTKTDRLSIQTTLERLNKLCDRRAKQQTKNKAFFGEWELSLQPRDRPSFPAWVTLSTECDRQGKIIGLRWLFRDITEYKQNQAKIAEQAALLDITKDAIVVRDLQQQILFWNRGAELLYGWSKSEALGKKVNELLYLDPLPDLPQLESILFSTGFWQGELNQVSKSGQNLLVTSRWSLVRDSNNQPKSILEVNSDITQQKQLEKQLQQIQRLESIGTLASGIAHDLNNILTPMLGIAQLLPLKLPEIDEQTRELLEFLGNNSRRGADLVKQILLFSQQIDPQPTILRVDLPILEVKNFIQQTIPKSITVTTQLPEDLWQIRADETQLHQVLMNLCVNARDAMADRGGTLTISAKNFIVDQTYTKMNPEAEIGNYIAITIGDTGMGIEPKNIERIFEPFFTTKEHGKGTGLGLSTTRGIIKNHGGFITVSTRVGEGTEFSIYLPAIEAKSESETRLSQLDPLAGNGELIFVIDDETSIREIAKVTLETYNYKVLTASDGLEAIALYSQHKDEIKVAIVDLMMPQMDGLTAIQILRKINPQVEAIAVSGLTSIDKIAATKRAGIARFLSKPYSAEDLLLTLKKVLTPSQKIK